MCFVNVEMFWIFWEVLKRVIFGFQYLYFVFWKLGCYENLSCFSNCEIGGWAAWLESIVSLTKVIRKYTKILAVGSCTLRGLKKCSTRDLGTNSSVCGQVYCIYTVTILCAPLLDYRCCQPLSGAFFVPCWTILGCISICLSVM